MPVATGRKGVGVYYVVVDGVRSHKIPDAYTVSLQP